MAQIIPVIPENITVHLGNANSPAPNVTVPFIDYIKVLVDELDFAVIPFNKYILESNNYLKTNSKEYFSSIDPNDLDLLNRYNLDSKFLFNKKQRGVSKKFKKRFILYK